MLRLSCYCSIMQGSTLIVTLLFWNLKVKALFLTHDDFELAKSLDFATLTRKYHKDNGTIQLRSPIVSNISKSVKKLMFIMQTCRNIHRFGLFGQVEKFLMKLSQVSQTMIGLA